MQKEEIDPNLKYYTVIAVNKFLKKLREEEKWKSNLKSTK